MAKRRFGLAQHLHYRTLMKPWKFNIFTNFGVKHCNSKLWEDKHSYVKYAISGKIMGEESNLATCLVPFS
jgi:hypothetical protein